MLMTAPDDQISYNFQRITYSCLRPNGQSLDLQLDAVSNFENVVDQLASQLASKGIKEFPSDQCPYFGLLWPSAQILTEQLVSAFAPRAVEQNPIVLELGCGLGLPSIALQLLGCQMVAVDHHAEVEKLLMRNCALNGVTPLPQFILSDWTILDSSPLLIDRLFDAIIASDILYEAGLSITAADTLIRLGKNHLVEGGEIWVADPGRTHLQEFVIRMNEAGFQSSEFIKNDIFVLRFRRFSGF
jgi:predicted nicotinamide N-methyase